MPRTIYVNSVYTIPAGGAYTSYQYEPAESFFFGFTNTDKNGKVITDSRCTFDLAIELSNSVGGDDKEEWDFISTDSGTTTMQFYTANDNRRYCNGILTNTSSVSAKVRILTLVDEDEETLYELLS